MVGITCLLCKEPIRTLAELRAICRVNDGKPHWVRDVEEQGLRESEASAITQPGRVYAEASAITQPGMVYAPDAPAEFVPPAAEFVPPAAEFVPPAVEPSPEPEPFEPGGGDFGGGGASGDFGGGGDAGGGGSSGGD